MPRYPAVHGQARSFTTTNGSPLSCHSNCIKLAAAMPVCVAMPAPTDMARRKNFWTWQGNHACQPLSYRFRFGLRAWRFSYLYAPSSRCQSWGPWRGVEVRSGDLIEVTYLPDNPGRSVPGKPDVAGWWVLSFIVLPGMAALAAFFGLWRWQASNKPAS